jgi:hypothetical protein
MTGILFSVAEWIFIFTLTSTQNLEPSFKARNGSTFIGEKRPQREASLSPGSGVEFKIRVVTSYPHFPMHLHGVMLY